MTVSNDTSKVTASGNDAAVDFSFSPLVIFQSSDLVVTHVAADGTETLLVEGSSSTTYSVEITTYPATGAIKYPAVGGTPLATGASLVMKRVLPLEQEVNLGTQGGYFPQTQEAALDKLTMQNIQQQESIERAVALPISSTGVSAELPNAVASKFLAWNASATALFNSSGSGTPASVYMATLLDDETASEAQATLELTPGTDVQAQNAKLQDIADLTPAQGDSLTFNGTNWVLDSDANRSIIINGAMQAAFQGTSYPAIANGVYPLEQWRVNYVTTAVATASQDTSGVFADFGFKNALKIDVTTADAAVAAGDVFYVSQPIEGLNIQDLNWGDADAKSVTVAFVWQSPKAGVQDVALYGGPSGYHHIKEITVDAADTPQLFIVTFPGLTDEALTNDTSEQLRLAFPLMAGTDWQAAADAWAIGEDYATANQQNLLDDAANNIYLSGVSAVAGEAYQPFVHEDYAQTEFRCMRYARRLTDATGVTDFEGRQFETTLAYGHVKFSPPMRIPPLGSTVTTGISVQYLNTSVGISAFDAVGAASSRHGATMTATHSAVGTQGHACAIRLGAGDYIDFDARMT